MLHDPSELFGVKPEAMLERDAGSNLGPIRSSTSCLAGRVRRQDRIIVTLPASEITDGVAENLHLALRRYCEPRLTLVQRETQVAWRQGLRSLGSGSILFLVGLLLSAGFLEPDVPRFWQNPRGNGVFPVVGWVGLWYPLDLLFFARQPLKREARILTAISQMPLFGATRPRPVTTGQRELRR